MRRGHRLDIIRTKVMVGGAAFVLAVVVFVALAGLGGIEHSIRGGGPAELEQTSNKLHSFETKLSNDKSQLDTVIHRLGEIRTAEAKIKQEQAALLEKERATRAKVHEKRNKVVSLKYKIHNMKAVAFSNAMFGLSDHKSGKKAKAHANLERKAHDLEEGREANVRKEEHEVAARNVALKNKDVEGSHVLHKDAVFAPQRPAVMHSTGTEVAQGAPRTKNAAIIAEGLRKAKAQIESVRRHDKAGAAARLREKAMKLEKERDASEKMKMREVAAARKHADEIAARKQMAEKAAVHRDADAKRMMRDRPQEVKVKDLVSRMQARVLRKRVAALATHEPRVIGRNLEMHVTVTHMPSAQAAPHKPLTLEEAAEEAAKNAAVAQKLAFMRSPQYWATQHVARTTKRYGLMPGLPLLAPLNPAAADP